jgi:predicted transcriptional regulator
MTRSEKLDQILYILLWIDKEELANKKINKKVTMPFINTCIENELEPWEMKSLQNELIEEEYITSKNEDLRITQKGKKFITRERGFKHLDRKNEQEQIIAEKTIEKFKYDKFSFWFSIIAIIISLISIFIK